jgi:hypothetical protein
MGMEKRFRIVESKMVTDDTLILVSSLTMDKIKDCHTMMEVFKLLLEKKNLILVDSKNWFNN